MATSKLNTRMAATKFQRAKFSFSPFSPAEMVDLGNTVLASVKKRIHAGLTVTDAPAKPLKGVVMADSHLIPYSEYKAKKGLQAFRDLQKTGALMNSIQVIRANQDSATIASNNVVKDAILHRNQKYSPMFGVSPTDTQVMQQKVREMFAKAIGITQQ